MAAPFKFASSGSSSALVILFPPGVKGLFNAEVHRLVREVQEQLDTVYVTYALSNGGSPDLRDAMAAARFAGCESAVIIPAADSQSASWNPSGMIGDWMVDATTIPSGPGASAVVDAYMAAVAETTKAA